MREWIIFGGTVEARQLAEYFSEKLLPKALQQPTSLQIRLHICVATAYGASLLPQGEWIQVHIGRMREEDMERLLQDTHNPICIDLTHPYAAEVTENIRRACDRTGTEYIRVDRGEAEFGERGHIHDVADVAEAVRYLGQTEGKIFLTTGSKELSAFTGLPDYQHRCVARVLPTVEVLELCRSNGFEGKNLIAMQGPFTEELNYQMFAATGSRILVTKSSGAAGGYTEKCEAALRLGMEIVVIGRPVASTPDDRITLLEVMRRLERETLPGAGTEEHRHEAERTIYLVGMGPGAEKLMTEQAKQVLAQCDVIIGAQRVQAIWNGYKNKPHFTGYKVEEIAKYLEANTEYREIALVYSGDTGFYSGADKARRYFEKMPEYRIVPVMGMSSVLYFMNRIGKNWEHTLFTSAHGRELDMAACLEQADSVCTLLGGKNAVAEICTRLVQEGLTDVVIRIGERLSYPEECIYTGCPEDFIKREFDSLSVMLVEKKQSHTTEI